MGATPRILKSEQSLPGLFEEMWATILSGRTYRGVIANRKKNGEVFYEEKAITPIRDGQGKITHFVSVGRDITARREAEEVQLTLQTALRKSAEEWKATFDAVESPIVLAAPTGRVKRLNRAARDLWGEPYERILGHPLSAQPDEPWGTMQTAVEAVAQTHASVSLPAESRDRTRTWGVSASPLPSSPGEPAVIVLAKDISAIVQLQSSLRHNERMSAMGSLVAGVAHEVRNPLFGISSTLDAFEARFGRREEYEQYVAILREQLERMTDFMRELLEYGKPAPLELAAGVLEDVIAQAAHACGALARRSSVKIANNVKRGLPQVLMDRRRLVQVFQNLIDNAVRHSPSGATVAVEAGPLTTENETWIHCQVVDAGPGFRTDDLAQVFEPFFTRRRGGTGLGLSIVQRIVEEHGGSVTAENRPEGGAVMRVRLPAVAPPADGGSA
jgi:signal transduction histidine kinase